MSANLRLVKHVLTLEALREYTLCYLATPYSKYPAGIETAFIDACKLAARLAKERVNVYCPIALTHPLAVNGGIDPLDHEFWMRFDTPYMTKSNALVVAKMESWETSRGIEHEREFFNKWSKPIYFIDPETLEVSK